MKPCCHNPAWFPSRYSLQHWVKSCISNFYQSSPSSAGFTASAHFPCALRLRTRAHTSLQHRLLVHASTRNTARHTEHQPGRKGSLAGGVHAMRWQTACNNPCKNPLQAGQQRGHHLGPSSLGDSARRANLRRSQAPCRGHSQWLMDYLIKMVHRFGPGLLKALNARSSGLRLVPAGVCVSAWSPQWEGSRHVHLHRHPCQAWG